MQQFTGLEYLFINLANAAGFDKLVWDDRIQKGKELFDANFTGGDEPCMVEATKNAIHQVLNQEEIGFPISLDATCSGMQILSCLCHDSKAAKLCNVHNAGKRNDAYTILYEKMKELGASEGLKRSDVKQAIMTSLYGSQKVPELVFGKKDLDIFFQVVSQELPDVWSLNTAFLDIWNPQALEYRWMMPDGFEVVDKVMTNVTDQFTFMGSVYEYQHKENKPKKKGRSLGANIAHSIDGYFVREMIRRCSYNPEDLVRAKAALRGYEYVPSKDVNKPMVEFLWDVYQRSGMLSASIISYLDSESVKIISVPVVEELISRFTPEPFNIMTIHDCFRVHPNDGNEIRRVYRDLLVELSNSNMLTWITSQIGTPLYIQKDMEFIKKVIEEEYALT